MSEHAVRTVSDATQARAGRRALRAAMFGFFVDMYDVYLPVIVLAPAIAYFSPADASPLARTTLTGAIFAASLIGRPLGSVIFGVMGDRLGRRRTTIWVATGFTVCTGIIALLPGYPTIGVLAPVLLVLLRLLDGVFLGGEYTAANPLAMEYAPAHRRGLYGALLNIGYPAALGVITVLTMVLLKLIPSDGVTSPYAVWGWRIPFAVGFVLSAAIVVSYVRSVPESELWTKMPKAERPLRTLFTGRNLRSFGLAFLVGTGAWLTLDATVGVFAGHFATLGASSALVNATILAAAALAVCMFPFVGAAGQRYGRRAVFLVLGGVNLVVGPILFGVAIAGAHNSAVVLVCGGLALLCALPIWAMISAYLLELFPTAIRSSGYGIAYSLPSVLPAFYPYVMAGLAGAGIMPFEYTPVVLLAIGGLFLIAGAARSRDLRHVDLADA